jgi:hypothetical protein
MFAIIRVPLNGGVCPRESATACRIACLLNLANRSVLTLYFNTSYTTRYGGPSFYDATSVTDRPFSTNALMIRRDK